MLPDVALLEVFDDYVNNGIVYEWYMLVKVCRKWRNIIFGSPRRLHLRLYSMAWTPVRETLDAWPALPIVVWNNGHEKWGVDNIVAALEHNDRIYEIYLCGIRGSQFETVLAALQQPFPALTSLVVSPRQRQEAGRWLRGDIVQVQPDSFLGGYAPRLQSLSLDRIPFPGLPKLLLSATHLVRLSLWSVPDSGYISPEALATCLSVLTRLERLSISPQYCPDRRRRRPPPQTRVLLPVLTDLWFYGFSEYLEDFVARLDTPLLRKLSASFFLQLIIDIPQLAQFIRHTPELKTQNEACVEFSDFYASVRFPQTSDGELSLAIPFKHSDWELSSLAQICNSLSFHQALIPAVERLYIQSILLSRWRDDMESVQWLELLSPFSSVKDLYISLEFTSRIAPALQELVEGTTEVLPALQTLFLEATSLSELVQENIGKFVSARQLSGQPITVSHWERKRSDLGLYKGLDS
jgi:hypothetical protein